MATLTFHKTILSPKYLSSFYPLFVYHCPTSLRDTYLIRWASHYSYKALTPLQKSIKTLKKTRNPITGDKRPGRDFNYNMELSALAKRLGHPLKLLPSLQSALIHESALVMDTDTPTNKTTPINETLPTNETTPMTDVSHNADLVTLGEMSLCFYCRSYLINTYPNLRPPMVTAITSHLLSLENLNKLCRYLGVANLLVTSEEPSDEVFAKTLTAVFGAVQTDLGAKAVSKLIKDFVLSNVQDVELKNTLTFTTPKLMLQNLMKRQGREWPVPRLIKETGRLTHFPTFVVGFYVDGHLIGEGAGSSLKRAQNEAASAALRDHFLSRVKLKTKEKQRQHSMYPWSHYDKKRNEYSLSNNFEKTTRQTNSDSSHNSQVMSG